MLLFSFSIASSRAFSPVWSGRNYLPSWSGN